MFRKTSHDGELLIDHRASPGIPAKAANRLGFAPDQVREGAVFECATLGCSHCGSCVVLNPHRVRERAYCPQCDRYICDGCDIIRHEPDYVHSTVQQVVEKVKSGRYILVGSIARGKLIPTGD